MTDTTILAATEIGEDLDSGGARSLGQDAWRALKQNPLFWVSSILIVIFLLMAAFPGLFTQVDPTATDTANTRATPSADAWFGRDFQGYDVFSRTIHGARASILVGVFATLAVVVVGVLAGVVAGYAGGWVDSLISRIMDVFFAIPFLLGTILFMSTFRSDENSAYLAVVGKVVLALSILGWPGIARLMRSSVLQVKPNDYVQAARALGAGPFRIIRSHILPNAMAPVIVVSTINLGAYIAAEATLSFLGVGLVAPAVSWGVAINDALSQIRASPHILLFPSLFLSLAVLAFIMLGDAVRDAFDPKTR